jgi:hypothetical protein
MKHLSLYFLLVCFICSFMAKGQERIGIALSPFSGIDGREINPANISGTPYKWDVRFLSVHGFLDNNYMFISRESIISSLKRSLAGEPTNYANEWTTKTGDAVGLLLYDYDNPQTKKAHLRTTIGLPSIMMEFRKFSLALHSDFRVAFSVVGLNSVLAKWLYEGLNYQDLMGQEIKEDNFRLTAGSWLENGITFSFSIKETIELKSFGAISYSYLSGANNYYIIGENASFVYPNSADIDFNALDLEYGHALSTTDFAKFYGNGHSVNLGYIIQAKDNTSRYEFCYGFNGVIPKFIYKWRFGVSLLDIGYLKFDKEGTIQYSYKNVDYYWLDIESFSFEGIQEMDILVEQHFKDSSDQTISQSYNVMLPWAISVQYDRKIREYPYYVSAAIVQRIPHFGLAGYDRANTIAITPRLDKRKFAVALPITIYEYRDVRLGISLRASKYFSIGMHNVGAFVKQKRLDSGSLYFSFRFGMM